MGPGGSCDTVGRGRRGRGHRGSGHRGRAGRGSAAIPAGPAARGDHRRDHPDRPAAPGQGRAGGGVAPCHRARDGHDRRWALTHKDEFALVFGVPLPGLDDGRYDIADECALAFAGTFFTLFLELWHKVPFRVPDDEQIDPGLRDQLSRYRDALGTSIPLGAVMTFLRCWTVLDGAVAMEGFGHLRFALEDPAPMFEITLGDLATLVGLRYPLPG